jgi:UDP-N-acetylglucosamine 2-epimerase
MKVNPPIKNWPEWVELIEVGWNKLVGADTDNIIRAVKEIKTPENYPTLYGDGRCAEKIITRLKG